MKTRIIFIFIILLIIISVQPVNSQNSEERSIDCSYYYAMAYKTLKVYTQDKSLALKIALTMKNKELPGVVGKYHKAYYDDIIRLINISIRYHEQSIKPQLALEGLTNIYTRLTHDYNKYSQRLAQCVHDPQIAATLSAETRILIKYKILPDIAGMIREIVLSGASQSLKIIPGSELYYPGDTATIFIYNNSKILLKKIELVEWPTLSLIEEFDLSGNNTLPNNIYKIKIPYAYQLTNPMAINEFAKSETRSFAIFAIFINNSDGRIGYSVAFINASYKVPWIMIKAPPSVSPKEGLKFSLLSDDYYYNATILINNKIINIINITKGVNNLTLNLNNVTIKRNIILLQIHVPPGNDYLGVDKIKPIIYAEKSIPLKIEAPDTVYTWLGWISLKITGNASGPVVYSVALGPLPLYRRALNESTVSFFASILPITPLKVSIYIGGEKGNIYYSKNIIIINPTYIIILTLSLIIFAYRGSTDKISIITISSRQDRLTGLFSLAKRGIRRVYGRIAQLYYQTIILLKERLPYPQETLREHFNSLAISDRIRKPLWRLLRFAERDLYSKNKPSFEEAEAVFREVIKNARKK